MKRRMGFVSNSSSTSFVCCISGKYIVDYCLGSAASNGFSVCKKCDMAYHNDILRECEIEVNPDEEGYIDSCECVVCTLLNKIRYKYDIEERSEECTEDY